MIFGSALEAPTGVAGLDDVAVVGQAIEQRFFAAPANSYARRLLDSVRLCLFARGACDAVAETAATASSKSANSQSSAATRGASSPRARRCVMLIAQASHIREMENQYRRRVVPPPKAKFAPSA